MRATSEAAFEAHIEQYLKADGGYVARSADPFDMDRALIANDLVGYIRDT